METRLVVEKTEIAVDIVCEESYWKRFMKGKYKSKYGNKHKWDKKNEKCNTDFSWNDIWLSVSSCQTTCTIKN